MRDLHRIILPLWIGQKTKVLVVLRLIKRSLTMWKKRGRDITEMLPNLNAAGDAGDDWTMQGTHHQSLRFLLFLFSLINFHQLISHCLSMYYGRPKS